MNDSYKFLRVVTEDGIRVATMGGEYPENRFHPDDEWELHDLAAGVASDDGVKALVLTGAGDHFSSGVAHVAGSFDPYGFYERARALINGYINLDKPVIMALNGPAYGTGLTLALTGDIIIAERQVPFVDEHVKTGFLSATGAYLWPRSTGLLQAKRFLMTGDEIDAQTAREIGLVTEVVDTGKALSRAMEYAEKFASMPAAGVQGTKRALNQWMRRASHDVLDHGLAEEFLRFPVAMLNSMATPQPQDAAAG